MQTPDGFQPVVLVFLVGQSEPLELGFVRTRRDPDYPWVRLEISRGVAQGVEPGPVDPTARWVYVHENDVQRVELRLREAPAFGFFSFELLEDDDPDA